MILTLIQLESLLGGNLLFLLRDTPSNIFFSMGGALVLIGFFYYIIDIKQKDNIMIRILSTYGMTSLTLLFLEFLILPLFSENLVGYIFLVIFITYYLIVGLLMSIWVRYGKGILTIEWIIRKSSGKSINELI